MESARGQGWCCGETAWRCVWQCEACAWRYVLLCEACACCWRARQAAAAAVACPAG